MDGLEDEEALRVVLGEHEPVFMRGLEATLEIAKPPIQIVGKAMAADEGVTVVSLQLPDVVLIDLRLPPRLGPTRPAEEFGISAIRRIAQVAPTVRILVLSYLDEPTVLFEALSAGAHGYISAKTTIL
jgi:DNA-binding NarL/FixJ family response regulator